jgi:hypothetical protein
MTREQRHEVFALINRAKATADFGRMSRSADAFKTLSTDIAAIRANHAGGPPFLHFVYGFKQQETFPFYAYMAIESARYHNPGWPVVFCYVHEPTGPWWAKIKPHLVLLPMQNFDYFKGSRFHHYAHKADVIRLLLLRELGGVYLDMDTLSIRPFADLAEHEFGMAVQAAVHDSAAGLCNAVMWGKPGARFVRLWIDEYSHFRSKGHDNHWDYHSVRLPGYLLRKHADHITILGHRAFFNPLWTDIERILFSERGPRYIADLECAYGFHLWNGGTEKTLRTFTPEWVRTSKSAYAHFARPVLEAVQSGRVALEVAAQ